MIPTKFISIVCCLSLVVAKDVSMLNSQHHNLQSKHEDWMDKSLPFAHSTHELGHNLKSNDSLPSSAPTISPSASPSLAPSISPSESPSEAPSLNPSLPPTMTPSDAASAAPSVIPTNRPTDGPTVFHLGAEQTPLFPGYGTHFSYIYVGTPPQRQSVIIDTGSHITAFPCSGCKACGDTHTDKHWDIAKSSTIKEKICGTSPCQISQSYTEGSSWRATLMTDQLWVGDSDTVLPGGDRYAVPFDFGCQYSETGLFITQLADGIMGMSMNADTLPVQLQTRELVTNRIFALCFRTGGGIMTLGGVDQRIHTNKAPIQYVEMHKSNDWFAVTVLNVALQEPETNGGERMDVGNTDFDKGKGTIVDSGTTDTYLPEPLRGKFAQVFKELSGLPYSNSDVHLTVEQFAKLPTIVFVMKAAVGDTPVEIWMPPSSYMEKLSVDTYVSRVSLDEGQGAVLGANFMNNYNVIFDAEGKRLGFAPSTCEYNRTMSANDGTGEETKTTPGTDTSGGEQSKMSDGADAEDNEKISKTASILIGLGVIFVLWILIVLCLKMNEKTAASRTTITASRGSNKIKAVFNKIHSYASEKKAKFVEGVKSVAASTVSANLTAKGGFSKNASSGGNYELVSVREDDLEVSRNGDDDDPSDCEGNVV